MKYYLSLALVALVLFAGCNKKNSSTTEPKFTYTPPTGWVMRKIPGLTNHEIAFGPPVNNISPNINVIIEKDAGSMPSYEERSEKGIEAVFNTKVKARLDFTTAKGMNGRKLLYISTQDGNELRQTAYFFSHEGYKFVVTCTSPASKGDKYDSTFDESLRTFTILEN